MVGRRRGRECVGHVVRIEDITMGVPTIPFLMPMARKITDERHQKFPTRIRLVPAGNSACSVMTMISTRVLRVTLVAVRDAGEFVT